MNEREKSPKTADEQESPQPVRPTPQEETRREDTPEDKPSQAEGSREDVEE